MNPKPLAPLAVAALALAAGAASAHIPVPLDLSARVVESHNPGGIVYDDFDTVYGTEPDPLQSVERLYLRTPGANFSGHSTQIGQAFSSAAAASDGNGGVGVSWWLGGGVSPSNPSAYGTLDAQVTWAGKYQYLGSQRASMMLDVNLPTMIVGLIGVPPQRDSPNKIESAQVTVSVDSLITDSSGAVRKGTSFLMALRVEEYQLFVSPGNYQNFADLSFVGDWSGFYSQVRITRDQDEWSLDPMHGSLSVGTLDFGETVEFTYRLEASTSTFGYERGGYAFLGDPFHVDVGGGGIGITPLPVPEPSPALLLTGGLAWLAWRRRRAADRD